VAADRDQAAAQGQGIHGWKPGAVLLLSEIPVRQSEKRAHLRTGFMGRLFKIETDADVGREAFEQWSRPVRLRLIECEGVYEMWVCDAD
jgi:hypothetical protein